MAAFVLKGFCVRVDMPRTPENGSREPNVTLTLRDDESERDVKIPVKAWNQVVLHVAKVLREEASGHLDMRLFEKGEG